uniref:BZIP domain-containing protein n=1 Tax=Panagrellus redivivus TaxID=6233 RepID=A0A7E4VFD2_PANRE
MPSAFSPYKPFEVSKNCSNYFSVSERSVNFIDNERKRPNTADKPESDFEPRAKASKSQSPTQYSDHDDYLRDEKLNRRRRGNTESQARNRQHQKIVSEKYAENDRLIAWAKQQLIKDRTDAEQILRDILTKYETMPSKTRATRYDTRTTTGLINLCVP